MTLAILILLPLFAAVILTHQIRKGTLNVWFVSFPIKRTTQPDLFWLMIFLETFWLFVLWFLCLMFGT